jgi:hypothetical protein
MSHVALQQQVHTHKGTTEGAFLSCFSFYWFVECSLVDGFSFLCESLLREEPKKVELYVQIPNQQRILHLAFLSLGYDTHKVNPKMLNK